MIYNREILDRSTGKLAIVPIGDWITVTELGNRYGVGPRKVRAILHHMGILQAERGHYRLPFWAVERGLGRRHDRPKSGYAFDVISPLGQQLIDEVWEETVADYEADLRADARIDMARAALDTFKAYRKHPMTAQEEVCWLLDYTEKSRHEMTFEAIAKTIGVDRALVSRYAKRRARDKGFWRRWRSFSGRASEKPKPPSSTEAFLSVLAGADTAPQWA